MIKKKFSNCNIPYNSNIFIIIIFLIPLTMKIYQKTNFTLHIYRNLHLKVLHVPKSSDYAGRGNNFSFDSKNTHPGS